MLCSLNFHFSTHTWSVLVARAVWGEKHVVDICSCQLECRSRVCVGKAARFMFTSSPGPLAGVLEVAITSPALGSVHYTHQPDRNCYKFLNYIPLDARKCSKCLVSRPVNIQSHRRRRYPVSSHSSNIPQRLALRMRVCCFHPRKC